MSGRPSDDRLSAWLDDELSAEESAAFEKELEASPELQRQVDEFRQLTSLMKGAAQQKAPEGLCDSVLQAIEQPHEVRSESPSLGTWTPARIAAAIAGLAAAIVVTVVMNQDDNPNEVAEQNPQQRLTVERAVGPRPANLRESNPETVQVAGSLSVRRGDLTEAKVGDIIEGIGADGVSVIRLTVVDRNESSIEELQVLLAAESSLAGATPTQSEDGLVAVYVESSPEELSAALSRLRDSFEFNSLDVSSLAMSELEADTQDDLKQTKTGERVVLKPGSQLAKLVQEPAQIESASSSTETDGARRVIFVLVKDPNQNQPKPQNDGNSAA